VLNFSPKRGETFVNLRNYKKKFIFLDLKIGVTFFLEDTKIAQTCQNTTRQKITEKNSVIHVLFLIFIRLSDSRIKAIFKDATALNI